MGVYDFVIVRSLFPRLHATGDTPFDRVGMLISRRECDERRFPGQVARLSLLASWALVGACAFPELPALEGHVVGGRVDGLWTGADLELRLTGSAAGSELKIVNSEGAFRFDGRLDLGATYLVEVATQPEQHACSLTRATGTVDGDIGDVQVTCTSDIPVNVALASPTPFTFNSQLTTQSVEVSVLETEARFTVTAPAEAAIMVAGATTQVGVQSSPVPLGFGHSEVTVSIAVGALSRNYVVEFERGAVLPMEYARLVASNGEPADSFGETLAASGDRLVVGAIGEASNGIETDNSMMLAGAAYVFRRDGASWIQEAYLKGSPVSTNRLFGLSLAMQADTIVVGAHGINQAGAAYVYQRSPSQWGQTVRLAAPTPSSTDSFGFSVAIADPLIAVGDLGCQCVYLYRRSGTTWGYDATVTGPTGSNFGFRVALSGDQLVVGAPLHASASTGTMTAPTTDTGSAGNGAVFVYRETTASNWTLDAFVKPLTPIPNGNFGSAVSLDGPAFAVGAAARDDVHVIALDAGVWSQPTRIQTSQATQSFGTAVSLRRDVLAAGESPSNKVHLFRKSGTTWIEAGSVSRTAGMAGDRFGQSVALTGNGLAGGAHRTESDKGAAHVVR